jgi:predicted transcriptional regulator
MRELLVVLMCIVCFRHGQKVVIQMLEQRGAYRKDDPRTKELVVQQELESKRQKRKLREEAVNEMIAAAVEQVCTCSSLCPMNPTIICSILLANYIPCMYACMYMLQFDH